MEAKPRSISSAGAVHRSQGEGRGGVWGGKGREGKGRAGYSYCSCDCKGRMPTPNIANTCTVKL